MNSLQTCTVVKTINCYSMRIANHLGLNYSASAADTCQEDELCCLEPEGLESTFNLIGAGNASKWKKENPTAMICTLQQLLLRFSVRSKDKQNRRQDTRDGNYTAVHCGKMPCCQACLDAATGPRFATVPQLKVLMSSVSRFPRSPCTSPSVYFSLCFHKCSLYPTRGLRCGSNFTSSSGCYGNHNLGTTVFQYGSLMVQPWILSQCCLWKENLHRKPKSRWCLITELQAGNDSHN